MISMETDLKYVNEVDDNNNVVSMYLFSNIGGGGIDGQIFANDLQMVGAAGYDVKIHINSGGGSVMDGISIMRAIQNFPNNIETIVEGIAASIAGVIAVGSKNRTIVDFGRIMIHDPMFSGGAILDDKQKRALDSIRNMLLSIFENNTSVGVDELDNIMANETWLDADQCKEMGLVDSIVVTGRAQSEKTQPTTNILELVNNQFKDKTQTKKQTNKMEKIINHFDLGADASQTDILDKVQAIENELETTKADNVSLLDAKTAAESLVEGLQNEIAEQKKQIAENVVDAEITNGKFEEKNRAELVDQALEIGVDNFVKLAKSMKIPHADITNVLDTDDDITNGKSLRELEKTDSKLVAKIKNEQPELYKKMYKDQYGVELT